VAGISLALLLPVLLQSDSPFSKGFRTALANQNTGPGSMGELMLKSKEGSTKGTWARCSATRRSTTGTMRACTPRT